MVKDKLRCLLARRRPDLTDKLYANYQEIQHRYGINLVFIILYIYNTNVTLCRQKTTLFGLFGPFLFLVFYTDNVIWRHTFENAYISFQHFHYLVCNIALHDYFIYSLRILRYRCTCGELGRKLFGCLLEVDI